MLKLRVREYSPDGTRGRVLPTIAGTISVTLQENGEPVLKFALSTRTAGRMPDDGFTVRVEYQANGGRFKPLPEHDLFIITEDSGDDADLANAVTFSGGSYITFMLHHTYIHWAASAVNKIRKVSGAAGGQMHYFLAESKARGWGEHVTYGFDGTKDSNGVNWAVPGDVVVIDWQFRTPLIDVLSRLVDGGVCDWSARGSELRLFRPATRGVDRTELVLGGPRVERIPVKSSMDHVFTHLTVASDTGYWQYLTTGATSKWGKLEQTISMSGVGHMPTAQKLAAPIIAEGKSAKREESFEWTPEQGDLLPWEDFNIGDTLTARVRGGSKPRRIIGIVARERGESVTVRVVVGEKIGSAQSRVLSKLGAGSVGGVIGGTGNSFPGSIGPSALAPERPNGLVVLSNVGRWLGDFSAESSVEMGWAPVTSVLDGSEATIVEYEVWSRLPHEQMSHVTTIAAAAAPSVVVTSWAPGVERLVAVRARSAEGVLSDWSLEVLVTPASPASVAPKAPGVVTVASNVGAFTAAGPVATVTLTIPAVTQSTDNEPIEIAEYELWDANGPLLRVPASPAKVTLPTGGTAVYRARARTLAGVWGDLSVASATVTGASPAVQSGKNPTGVTGRTGFGVVACDWSGAFASAPAAHTLLNVQVQARVGTTGAWVMQGTMDRAGSVTLKLGEAGQTVQVQAVAYDRLGRVIGTSATVSVVVQGIELDDLDADITSELNALDAGVAAAQSAAGAAQTTANTAKSDAAAAATAAGNAQTTANTAMSDAAAAAGIAGGKADVLIQSAAPAAAMQKATTLWIDTTGGANTPKRWSGSAWVVVTDKAATDAAAAAAAAQSAANTADGKAAAAQTAANSAQSKADSAFANAAAAATAAGQAQTTADGKNRVWYLASAPAGTLHKVDDVWFNTSSGYQMARWNGTSWAVTQFGTNAIANLAITNALIANAAIDNAKIANVDAGKITTGFLAAARIAAMSITAAKLAVGDMSNMATVSEEIADTVGYANWTSTIVDGWAARSAITDTYFMFRRQAGPIPFKTGERIRVTFESFADAAVTTPIVLWVYPAQTGSSQTIGSAALTTTPQQFTFEFNVAPDTVGRTSFLLGMSNVAGRDVRLRKVRVYRMNAGELIVDGAVKARHVEMETGFFDKLFGNTASIGRVNVDHLAPNVGENLNLSANGTIVLMAGAQDTFASELAEAENAISTVETSAATAQTEAAAARAAAAVADGKALVAQQQAQLVADGLEAQKAVFAVIPTGAEVRSVDASSITRIEPGEISMLQGGVKLFQVRESRVIANELVANRAQIAGHVIEISGGGTVFRAL